MIQFSHIAPIPHLDLIKGRKFHLTLAHLVEESPEYGAFYGREKHSTVILDNSAFEMYKQGREMYSANKLLDLAAIVQADYIVLPDYPNQPGQVTIDAAKKWAPIIKEAGYKTFFCPQSKIGDYEDLVKSLEWVVFPTVDLRGFLVDEQRYLYQRNPLIDYVGLSILAIPNAYGVEKDNKLQRYVARHKFIFDNRALLTKIKDSGCNIHMLGMVDGPNEIIMTRPFHHLIDTWDSSSAIWAGLNGIQYDPSPSGLINGKFEDEVNFFHEETDPDKISLARVNRNYIDAVCRDNHYL